MIGNKQNQMNQLKKTVKNAYKRKTELFTNLSFNTTRHTDEPNAAEGLAQMTINLEAMRATCLSEIRKLGQSLMAKMIGVSAAWRNEDAKLCKKQKNQKNQKNKKSAEDQKQALLKAMGDCDANNPNFCEIFWESGREASPATNATHTVEQLKRVSERMRVRNSGTSTVVKITANKQVVASCWEAWEKEEKKEEKEEKEEEGKEKRKLNPNHCMRKYIQNKCGELEQEVQNLIFEGGSGGQIQFHLTKWDSDPELEVRFHAVLNLLTASEFLQWSGYDIFADLLHCFNLRRIKLMLLNKLTVESVAIRERW